MAATFSQRLAKAMAVDANEGTEHRGDAVLSQMLDILGRRARGELPKQNLERHASGGTTDQKVRRTAAASGSTAQRSGGGQGVGGAKLKKAPVGVLVKSAASASAAQPAPARNWTPQQIAAALEDGVRSGRISGTAAMAGMRAITDKR